MKLLIVNQVAMRTESVLSEAELNRLTGGWKRYLNPFRSVLSRIKAATTDDSILYRKALRDIKVDAESKVMSRLINAIIFIPATIFCAIALFLVRSFLVYPDVGMAIIFSSLPITLVSLVTLNEADFNRTSALKKARLGIIPYSPALSGCVALDRIMTSGSSGNGWVEDTLLKAGMTSDDIETLILTTVMYPLPEALALIERATSALNGFTSVDVVLSAPIPMLEILNTLEHAGISIRTHA